jgi:hypothetical protein
MTFTNEDKNPADLHQCRHRRGSEAVGLDPVVPLTLSRPNAPGKRPPAFAMFLKCLAKRTYRETFPLRCLQPNLTAGHVIPRVENDRRPRLKHL